MALVALFVTLLSCLSLSLSPVHHMSLSSMIPSFYFHLSPLYLCLSVCSPAVAPLCRPPSVRIAFPLLLLTTIAMTASALPPSFPFALETLILHLPAPPLTYPLLHSAPHLCISPITFPPLPILSLNRSLFKTAFSTIAHSPHTTLGWTLNPKLIPALLYSVGLTSVLHLTQIQIAGPVLAASTR